MSQPYLLLSEIFPPKTGGSGRWFWDLYRRIDADKVVVVTDEIDGSSDFDEKSTFTIYRTKMNAPAWGVISFSGFLFYSRMIFYVIKLIKKLGVSSIHCGRTLPEGVIALAIKFIMGIPYHCYVHGEDIEMCRTSREFSFLVRQVIKHADTLICNSNNSAELLRTWWNVREEQIEVLYPGVDASVFTPSTSFLSQSLFPGKKIMLTVSRLQPRKGHDILIRAMPEILQRHPDLLYIIIGSGDQLESLKELVNNLKLSGSVKFLGECSDTQIIEWYQRSDLFVLPNRQIGNDVEGFGIVLLEAQACSTAVIAGDSGGTRETMEIGKSGYILDCTKTNDLVALISQLFDQPKELKAMGEYARQRVLEQFDWPRVIDSATTLFEKKGGI